MGCLKLTYQTTESPLKVVYRNLSFEQNNAQRFLSVDPLTKSYPMLTPYQFASNTPIQAIDLDGLEAKIIVNSQYNIKRIAQLLHSSKSEVSQKVREQAALAIAYYSTEATYPNDANTRMYPDINFPESGLAAEGTVDNSFEGVQIWGTVGTDDKGNDINVYLGTVRKEKSLVEKIMTPNIGGKTRDATDYEKFILGNFDQELVSQFGSLFGRTEAAEYFKFLKEKGVIGENKVRGGGGANPFALKGEFQNYGEGDTTWVPYTGKQAYDSEDKTERIFVDHSVSPKDTTRQKKE